MLQGLSFSVEPGQIYALLGRNGEGKTTAMRIFLGFLEPMEGRTSILGVDSRELRGEHRERIGFVSEGHRLHPAMTVGQALNFEAGRRRLFKRDAAEASIARLGLRMRNLISTLSRGQRAQPALVFAVSGEPDVLVLDDPAMGLDVVVRRELLDTMVDLLSDRGCSVLFSSHILTDVERMADRVGILRGGRLIVDASLDELKRRVQKRFWTSANGATAPPECDGLLRAARKRDSYDLTLLDFDAEREGALRKDGSTLSDALVPSLEELFVDLTSERTAS